MALFILNKRYWPPLRLKQRADGAYVDGVSEQDLLLLSPVHEGCSAHPFPNTSLSPTVPSGRHEVQVKALIGLLVST
jgi:hypothetical protein